MLLLMLFRTCLILPELSEEISKYHSLKRARTELINLRRQQFECEAELENHLLSQLKTGTNQNKLSNIDLERSQEAKANSIVS
jgi:hypothetical protein